MGNKVSCYNFHICECEKKKYPSGFIGDEKPGLMDGPWNFWEEIKHRSAEATEIPEPPANIFYWLLAP